MKYFQSREILFSTSNIECKDLVMGARWPSHFNLTHVEDVSNTLFGDSDGSPPDCLIIDEDLPVVSDIRGMGISIPVLSLIVDPSVDGRIAALQAGADDCLGPVFSISELVVRIECLCRRCVQSQWTAPSLDNSLSLSTETQLATQEGKSVSLTPTETMILRLFLENQDRPLSADQVGRHVWGEDFGASKNLVCVHIANLRRKLDDLDWSAPIRTIRGRGYMLSSE